MLKNFSRPSACALVSIVRNLPRNRRASTFTCTRKFERDEIQVLPSSDSPPPGTIMCTCGWCVSADPHVWSTAVMPILAPSRLGSAAMVSVVSAAAFMSRS